MSSGSLMRCACRVSAMTWQSVLLPTRIGPSTAIYRGGSKRFAMAAKKGYGSQHNLLARPWQWFAAGRRRKFSTGPQWHRRRPIARHRSFCRQSVVHRLSRTALKRGSRAPTRGLLRCAAVPPLQLASMFRELLSGVTLAGWRRSSPATTPCRRPRSFTAAPSSACLPGSRLLALTYDDGPNDPYTWRLMEVLDRHQVKATFFLVGASCSRSRRSRARWSPPGTPSAAIPGTIPTSSSATASRVAPPSWSRRSAPSWTPPG